MNLALPSLHVGSLEITLTFPFKGTVREQLKKIIELWTNQYSFLVVFVKIILIYSSCFNPPSKTWPPPNKTRLFTFRIQLLSNFLAEFFSWLRMSNQSIVPSCYTTLWTRGKMGLPNSSFSSQFYAIFFRDQCLYKKSKKPRYSRDKVNF